MSDFNYKVRIPTGKEYDRLVNIAEGENEIIFWNGIFSWVDDPEVVAERPDRRALRGYYSARNYHCGSADYRDVGVGFRPAFESLNNDTLLAGIADGDVVAIGTLYMDGIPVKVPQDPTWNGDIENYIPGAKLEFGPIHDDPAYQVWAIKVGDAFICDRCLLKNISYEDITTGLRLVPAVNTKSNSVISITSCNCKVRIPTNKEYDRLMDVTAEDDAVTHWKGLFSWVDNPKLVVKYPNHRAFRGYSSARGYSCTSADYRRVNVGFRPAFEPLGNDTLPASAADGDVVVIGTLYMNGIPVRVPQDPTCDGDIEDYIPGAKLEFKPALDDSNYQVQAIRCGDAFICDRCLLKDISYSDIEERINASSTNANEKNNQITNMIHDYRLFKEYLKENGLTFCQAKSIVKNKEIISFYIATDIDDQLVKISFEADKNSAEEMYRFSRMRIMRSSLEVFLAAKLNSAIKMNRIADVEVHYGSNVIELKENF